LCFNVFYDVTPMFSVFRFSEHR